MCSQWTMFYSDLSILFTFGISLNFNQNLSCASLSRLPSPPLSINIATQRFDATKIQQSVLAPPAEPRLAPEVRNYVARHTEKSVLAPATTKNFIKDNANEAYKNSTRRRSSDSGGPSKKGTGKGMCSTESERANKRGVVGACVGVYMHVYMSICYMWSYVFIYEGGSRMPMLFQSGVSVCVQFLCICKSHSSCNFVNI